MSADFPPPPAIGRFDHDENGRPVRDENGMLTWRLDDADTVGVKTDGWVVSPSAFDPKCVALLNTIGLTGFRWAFPEAIPLAITPGHVLAWIARHVGILDYEFFEESIGSPVPREAAHDGFQILDLAYDLVYAIGADRLDGFPQHADGGVTTSRHCLARLRQVMVHVERGRHLLRPRPQGGMITEQQTDEPRVLVENDTAAKRVDLLPAPKGDAKRPSRAKKAARKRAALSQDSLDLLNRMCSKRPDTLFEMADLLLLMPGTSRTAILRLLREWLMNHEPKLVDRVADGVYKVTAEGVAHCRALSRS